MKYRLFASDMDDTLFGNDLVISAENLAAGKRLREAGVQLSFVTGRMYAATVPYLKAMEARGPVVCCQGALLADSQSGDILYYRPLEMQTALEILRLAEDNDTYSQYYDTKDFFYRQDCQESRRYAYLASHEGVATGKALSACMDVEPAKILFMCHPDKVRRLYDVALERFAGRAEVCISKPNYLEFSHPLANKGEGLRQLARHYDLPMEQVAAIGDGINDIPLIEAAGLGIAVDSGAPELKARAGAVVASCAGSGFAQAVNEYVLEG
ncbi:MAG: Cof-type HAD-IIB family hydrolase [Oscillospiraceae bacterium]|nr:Cof-type HAD-IIB family hydrolase [Oscillospiraceae bacterium]